jgi:hypothetical protein
MGYNESGQQPVRLNGKPMNSENYSFNNGNQKCQCITFDENGKIMGSNDTLFPAAKLVSAKIRNEFPFIWKVINRLKKNKSENEAVFYPGIEMDITGYRNVCDFTFMPSTDAFGIRRFICMIYDNSIHYRHFIKDGVPSKFSNQKRPA